MNIDKITGKEPRGHVYKDTAMNLFWKQHLIKKSSSRFVKHSWRNNSELISDICCGKQNMVILVFIAHLKHTFICEDRHDG